MTSVRFAFRHAKVLAIFALIILASAPLRASAGPPFVTDDPEPTDYRHWEIYTGFQSENAGIGTATASLPFAEFNYGAMPNVQVSLSAPLYEDDSGPDGRHGFGDVEFSIKTRFVQESQGRPQISFYPSVVIPTVTGQPAVVFLPVWMQKSSGPWTAFGGGGIYLDDALGMRDCTFVGAALERAVSPGMTIGVELYHQSSATIGGTDETAASIGAIAQLGRYHALLFSVGRALHGPTTFTGYASYEFALGPAEHEH